MRSRPLFLAVVPVLLLLLVGTALADEFERDFTFAGDELKLSDMIGEVRIVAATGDEFQVQVTVRGADATADFLDFVTDDADGPALAISFPLSKHKHYVYPPMGARSKTTMYFHEKGHTGKSWLKSLFSGLGGTKVTVRGEGRGQEVWADVTVAVPRGASLAVKLGVGHLEATDLVADLDLDINAGAIAVKQVQGEVRADTGSGQVDAEGIRGELDIDTGSGSVAVSDCEGSKIKVDTGSGGVTVAGAECEYLDVDTGSGGVRARNVATDRARLDTGSGSVLLQLDRMGSGKFVIDTGSGSIDLALPADASARVSAETGSGSVHIDFPGADVLKKDRGECKLLIGSGAARVKLDAGSGNISVSLK